ncbi:MAG: DUF927 domain-containing protein [Clostridia bacterium]|nr:DUF927 domain-containing protein [Clostridia bacterium]
MNGYFFQNGSTFVINSQGKKHKLCEEIHVTEVKKNISTGKSSISVSIACKDGPTDCIMSRGDLAGNFYSKLTACGLSMVATVANKCALQEILLNSEKIANRIYMHDWLGYRINGTDIDFYGAIGEKDGVKSEYSHAEKVASKGTFEDWLSKVKPLVAKKPELVIGMAFGASAPVAALLKLAGKNSEVPIWGLVGESSKGKTSTLLLAASVWGVPTNTGLIENFNGTQKYIYASLAEKFGFPSFYDETSAQPAWDFTQMVYKISTGNSGGKCASDGSVVQPFTWMGSFTFTGEKSILEQSNKNKGLFARVLEFDYEWTSDKKMAEEIATLVHESYGTAYQPFVSELDRYGLNLQKKYESIQHKLEEILKPKGNVAQRIINKLAILYTTIVVIDESWGLEVDRKKVLKLLKESYEKNIPKLSNAEAAYDCIKEYISTHANMFPEENGRHTFGHNAQQGELSTRGDRKCAWILDGVFHKILESAGINLSSSDYKEMREKKMMEYFGDRYKKSHKMSGMSVKCVCILLGDIEEKDKDNKDADSNSIKLNTLKGSKRNLLLA